MTLGDFRIIICVILQYTVIYKNLISDILKLQDNTNIFAYVIMTQKVIILILKAYLEFTKNLL